MTQQAAKSRTRYRILGSLEVERDGRVVPVGTGKQTAVLALLLLHANEIVSSDRLIDALWPDAPPASGANNLHVYISHLRKALPGDVLVTRKPGYVLRVEPGELDLDEFESLVQEGRDALARGDAGVASERLRAALALWRGPPLSDVAFEAFAQPEIARLEELRLAALEDRVAADLAAGRHGELVAELEQLVAEHPLREGFHGQLMLALYRAGRQAEALQAYQNTRRTLVDELGIDPSPALQRLEQAILLQDASLEAPPLAVERSAEAPAARESSEPGDGEPRREIRKIVTVLFSDVSGAPGARLDPEALRAAVERYTREAESVVGRYGGTAARAWGHTLMAVFGHPTVHEDDALRAVRAAVELRRRFGALRDELERERGIHIVARTGVDTGDVVAGSDASPASLEGAVLDDAVRLQQAAKPGEIVIGDNLRRLVGQAVEVAPGAPVADGWLVLEAAPDAPAIPRRPDAPMLARDAELAQLRQAFERAVRERRCHLFTVLGDAGIGKSRLAAELRAAVEHEATVVTGRCLSYGDGITFWPVAEVVEQLAGPDPVAGIAALLGPDDALAAERVASAVGLAETSATSEETFAGVRKLFEAAARERPLVVVFDDLHWAEQTFLDLVEHVAEWSRGAPILLVCLARPDLVDDRPTWGGGKRNATSLFLEPLPADACERLLASLLGDVELAGDAQLRILEAADGNPLFLEQMISLLVEDERSAPDAAGAGPAVAVPATIQALLAARLERLEPAERRVIECGAVVGKVFWTGAVAALLDGSSDMVSDPLWGLVRKELIDPQGSRGDTFRFQHLLIREAAYASIPKQRRAELHEAVAAWLETAPEERMREQDEIIGYHLEEAYRYRTELAPLDERARALAERAAERLATSGRRAYRRGDIPAAVSLLARSVSLIPDAHPERPSLLVELAEVLREIADFEWAGRVLDEASAAAAAAGDRRAEAHALVTRLRMQIQIAPDVTTDELRGGADRAIAVFEEFRDERGLSKALLLAAWAAWVRCQAAATEQAASAAMAHAEQADDTRAYAQSLNLFLGATLFGPRPVPEATRRCEQVLAEPARAERITASACRALAVLRAMEGRFDDARALVARDRALLHDLGLRLLAAAASELYGIVELLAGDPEAAVRELQTGYETLERMGARSSVATVTAILANASFAAGDLDGAVRFSEMSEEVATADDLVTQIQWRGARAKALARRGDAETAEHLAREAVDLAAETDLINLQGNTLADLADVLHTTGRADEARPLLEEALKRYRRKGNRVSAARTQAELDVLATSSKKVFR